MLCLWTGLWNNLCHIVVIVVVVIVVVVFVAESAYNGLVQDIYYYTQALTVR